MQIVYIGRHASVLIPVAGVVAERDVPVDVPDEIGTSLLEQVGKFAAPAKAGKKSEEG